MSRASSSRRAFRSGTVRVEPMEPRAYLSAVFTPQPTVPLPAPATGFAYQRPVVGDFDGDGKADVVVSILNTATQGQTGAFHVLKGNGDGTFAAPGPANAVASNYEPAAGDFDGDGDLDLAFSEFGTDQLHVFRNNGEFISGCGGLPLVNGRVTCSPMFNTPGTYSITGIYLGDNNYNGVTSSVLPQNVQ